MTLAIIAIYIEEYLIKTLHKNTKVKTNFMNTIRVDSKLNLKSKHHERFPDRNLTLEDDIREELEFLKDIKEDTHAYEIQILLDSLQQANGHYPKYDIEYLETFDIKALVYYTIPFGAINPKFLEKYSWHFFVYDIKKGNYPLERLPLHVGDILKERYYKNK